MKPPKPKRIKPNPKRIRSRSNRNNYNNTCTYCLSKLIVSKEGTWVCTGDRLKLWDLEFIKYSNMDKHDKMEYLQSISNTQKFVELYDKWLNDCLECGYTDKLYDGSTTYKTQIPDPILINKIERSLGRALTEEELLAEKPLWYKDGTYFADYKEGCNRVKIINLNFPEEC